MLLALQEMEYHGWTERKGFTFLRFRRCESVELFKLQGIQPLLDLESGDIYINPSR